MRAVVLFFLLLACARALDLAQLRASAKSKSLGRGAEPESYYDRFTEPLRADLAPLCGNGRIDTIADYVAFPNKNTSSGYFFYVNEVCDDGNRLDGDGCAADCARLDAHTTPCALALDVSGEALRFLRFLNESTLLVITPTRALYVDAVTLQTYTSTSMNDVAVVSGATFGGAPSAPTEGGATWLYGIVTGGGGRVWVLGSNASIAVEEASVGLWAPTEGGDLLLVTSAGQVVDAKRGRVMRGWTSSDSALASVTAAVLDGGSVSLTCIFDGLLTHSFVYAVGAGTLVNVVDAPSNYIDFSTALDDPTMDKWLLLFSATLAHANFRYLPPTSFETLYIVNEDSPTKADEHAQVSPYIVGGSVLSPRNAINHYHGRAYVLGDPVFSSNWNTNPDEMLCNGTDALCLLDVPLCYDPLLPNPYSVNGRTDTLYAALVAAAVGASKWSEVPQRAQLTRGCTPGTVTQWLTHPATGALWLVRGRQVFEVGRRGAQVRLTDGRCLPAHGGACPVGMWALPFGRCLDCAVNVSQYNATTAWQQQCAAEGGGRRLLAEKEQTIELVLVSNEITSAGEAAKRLAAAAGGVCTCMETDTGGAWRKAYACILTGVQDSGAALRALRAFDFVSPPSVVWTHAAKSTAGASAGPDVGVIVGATAAGVLGVVLVLGLFLWVLHRPRYEAVATTAPR